VNWSRNKLPERLEVLKCRLVRIEVMRGGIMYIRRYPECVLDTSVLNEGEDVRNFKLASARRTAARPQAIIMAIIASPTTRRMVSPRCVKN
jgi:hypothetical protein